MEAVTVTVSVCVRAERSAVKRREDNSQIYMDKVKGQRHHHFVMFPSTGGVWSAVSQQSAALDVHRLGLCRPLLAVIISI